MNRWLERFGDFMEGKGFYIVLFLCVAAIGISGYFLFSTQDETDLAAPVSGTAQVTVKTSPLPSPSAAATPSTSPTPSPSPSTTVTPVKPTPHPSAGQTARDPETPSVKVVEESPSPSPTPTPSASQAPQKPVATVYTWPVKGEILQPYSPDLPIMNVTMGDRRTHGGIDIASPLGTQVKAAGAGTVTAVKEDYFKGVMVTIDHGNGVESTCYNLAGQPVVKEGDTVSVGDVIGSVGTTARLEINQEPHLHFEMTRDGAPVDPEEYLPEMK